MQCVGDLFVRGKRKLHHFSILHVVRKSVYFVLVAEGLKVAPRPNFSDSIISKSTPSCLSQMNSPHFALK